MNANLNFAGLPDGISLLFLGSGSILAALCMRKRAARAREGADISGISAANFEAANPTMEGPRDEQMSAAAPFRVEDSSPTYQAVLPAEGSERIQAIASPLRS